ncbi:MAG: TldD/PmbA family protein [Chloroflexi bacterium]|nr:TldD/PmbA family protein [Chloroflexota bacterium]
MEDILGRAKKVAEEAEVFSVSSQETPIQFEANRLKHAQSKQSTSVALRIIKNGKTGYATATESANPQNLVDMAVETAQFGMEAKFEFPPATAYPRVDVFDSSVESVPIEEMVKLGEELISRLRAHTPDLLCHAWVSKDVASVHIINSHGGQASYKQTGFSLSVWANLIRNTDMLFVGDGESSCHPIKKPDEVARTVLWQLEHARNRASAPTKLLPVVFTPLGAADALIPSLMIAFNGKTVLQGASPIGKKLGERVFDEKLQLWDDPTIPYRPSSRPCDEEGVPSQRTALIEKGVVASFLYDLQTAALAKARSTGNGSRGRGLPSPSPSAFVLAPGTTSFDDMVKDMKEGLVIEQLMGAEQGNILGGEFSGNVLLGYKVESGTIVGRIKDTIVSGNVYELLKNVAAIGSEARWVGSSLQIPALYFHSLSVATKS